MENCNCESCGCGNCAPIDNNPSLPSNNIPGMEYMRSQEMLSTIEEKTDHEISGVKECGLPEGGIIKDLTLEIGCQTVLVPEGLEGDVSQLGWENSNPRVINLQPTQSFSHGTIMAIAEGNAEIKASCLRDYSKFCQWNITVGSGSSGEGGEQGPTDENPKEDDPECNCPTSPEELKEEIVSGGDINLNPSSQTQIDLGSDSLVVDGVESVLEMNDKVSIVSEGDVFVVKSGSTLKISGEGTVTGGEGKTGNVITAEENSSVEISGGKFIATGNEIGEGNSCVYSSGGKVEITGGTYESTATSDGKYYVLRVDDMLLASGGKAIDYIEVSGGTFVNFDPSLGNPGFESAGTFVKDGYMTKKEGNSFVVVEIPEDEIPEEKTDAEIENELETVGGNITLTRDFHYSEGSVYIKKDTVLDLGGNTVTSQGGTYGDTLKISKNTTVTLKNGTINACEKIDNSSGVILLYAGCNVTLENINAIGATPLFINGEGCKVTIRGGRYITPLSTQALYIYKASKVTIESGTFGSENYKDKNYTLNIKDGVMPKDANPTDFFEVLGGRFIGFDPSVSNAEPQSPISYVPEGYKTGLVESEGKKIYIVANEKSLPEKDEETGETINWSYKEEV